MKKFIKVTAKVDQLELGALIPAEQICSVRDNVPSVGGSTIIWIDNEKREKTHALESAKEIYFQMDL